MLAAASAACLCLPALAAAFDNTEPLAASQWYLEQDRAWNAWPAEPQLATVKVAVIDTGIDAGHPDLRDRIAGGRSFTSGSWRVDRCGHGTFVAGIIAADPGNGLGIAGLAFNARLMVAKIARPDCTISLAAEVAAIRWAVDGGARVINLSIGGVRDPSDPQYDHYSPGERAALEYAAARGVVVVAAAGNGSESPRSPWPYAAYPAALPHVLGVAALRQDGSVPDFSNRDPVFVDLAAPGDRILSTIPRNLVESADPSCAGRPYSDCGPPEFRNAIGTSFAAPQVAAAAALLIGTRPDLAASQVAWLLERSARDETPGTGCPRCPVGRDSLTGWGRLQVAVAVAMLQRGARLPQADAFEPNDGAGNGARPLGALRSIEATVDPFDDPIDVYSIPLARGERIYARLSSPGKSLALRLWAPGTTNVDPAAGSGSKPVATGVTAGGQQRLSFVAPRAGRYFVEVQAAGRLTGPAQYRLGVSGGVSGG